MTTKPAQTDGSTMLDQFYSAYGSAMFAWQEVETALFKLYHALRERGGSRDIMSSSRAYYGKHSFGPKLRLVDDAVRASNVEGLIEWDTLHKDLRDASQERNTLAHRPVSLVPAGDGVSLKLASPMFAPLQALSFRPWGREYDTDGCQSLACDFEKLAKNVDHAFELVYRDTRTSSNP